MIEVLLDAVVLVLILRVVSGGGVGGTVVGEGGVGRSGGVRVGGGVGGVGFVR